MKPHLTIALAAVLALGAATATADDAIGVVKRAKGPVVIERGTQQLTAAPGVEVQRGDRVVTGPNGYASINLRGTAPVSVGPEADVGLDRFVADERPMVQRFMQPIIQGVASLMGGISRH
jgi:hypothetical protein